MLNPFGKKTKQANREKYINQVKIILTVILTADGTPDTTGILLFCYHGFKQGSSQIMIGSSIQH